MQHLIFFGSQRSIRERIWSQNHLPSRGRQAYSLIPRNKARKDFLVTKHKGTQNFVSLCLKFGVSCHILSQATTGFFCNNHVKTLNSLLFSKTRAARRALFGSFALRSPLPVQDGLLEDCKELQAGTSPLVEQLLIQNLTCLCGFQETSEVCYLEERGKKKVVFNQEV